MQQPCASCGILIQTGERVVLEVSAIYRQIPSTVTFAIQQSSLEAVPGTMRHAQCPKEP